MSANSQQRCNVVPQQHKLRRYILYYKRLRDEGKPWMPKPTSKLAIYCNKHGLDIVKVIDGEQKLDISVCEEPEFVSEYTQITQLINFYRQKKEEILAQRPWLPTEGSKLSIWCKKHGVDIDELVDGSVVLDDILAQ